MLLDEVRAVDVMEMGEAHDLLVSRACWAEHDDTFIVASSSSASHTPHGRICVYSSTSMALMHQFQTIHPKVNHVQYTSFSDSIVSLEERTQTDSSDASIPSTTTLYLCVYHGWRTVANSGEGDGIHQYPLPTKAEAPKVRAYTLPLMSSGLKAFSVCSFTGRVAILMQEDSVINVWQCSDGFFEHVFELKIRGFKDALQFVAVHGVYVAYASKTELRVTRIDVVGTNLLSSGVQETRHTVDNERNPAEQSSREIHSLEVKTNKNTQALPEDSPYHVSISYEGQDRVAPLLKPRSENSSKKPPPPQRFRKRRGRGEVVPQGVKSLVFNDETVQMESDYLAGLIDFEDVRVNEQHGYSLRDQGGLKTLIHRFFPLNRPITELQFLPETLGSDQLVDDGAFSRLLITTHLKAFMYYFISKEKDVTRMTMSRKVFGWENQSPGWMDKRFASTTRVEETNAKKEQGEDESSVTHANHATSMAFASVLITYSFTSPVIGMTTNSLHLYVITSFGLEVWSLWSPKSHAAALNALSHSFALLSTDPVLLTTHRFKYANGRPVTFRSQMVAFDKSVVLFPTSMNDQVIADDSRILSSISTMARSSVPFMSPDHRSTSKDVEAYQVVDLSHRGKIIAFPLIPSTRLFDLLRSHKDRIMQVPDGTTSRYANRWVDTVLHFFSLLRYRANVYSKRLDRWRRKASEAESRRMIRLMFSLSLEATNCDRLAQRCAGMLGDFFLYHGNATTLKDWSQAACLFAASNYSPRDVLRKFQESSDDGPNVDNLLTRQMRMEAVNIYVRGAVFRHEYKNVDGMQEDLNGLDAGFTRLVLEHYGLDQVKELSNLVINSKLSWNRGTIEWCYDRLSKNESDACANPPIEVHVARLVLLLQGYKMALHAGSKENVEEVASNLKNVCSQENILNCVQLLLKTDPLHLIRICASHPEFLVNHNPSGPGPIPLENHSILTLLLRECCPQQLVTILMIVLQKPRSDSKIMPLDIEGCLSLLGEEGLALGEKVFQRSKRDESFQRKTYHQTVEHDSILVLMHHYLCLYANPSFLAEASSDIVSTVPRLRQGQDSTFDHLRLVAIAYTEVLHETLLSNHSPNFSVDQLTSFQAYSFVELPDWCAAAILDDSRKIFDDKTTWLKPFTRLALELAQASNFVDHQAILNTTGFSLKEIPSSTIRIVGILRAMYYGRLLRYAEGIGCLLSHQLDFLVKDFCIYYCSSVTEWAQVLTALSDPPKHSRESELLQDILFHMSTELRPRDFLASLPMESNLLLYLPALEKAMHPNHVHEDLYSF